MQRIQQIGRDVERMIAVRSGLIFLGSDNLDAIITHQTAHASMPNAHSQFLQFFRHPWPSPYGDVIAYRTTHSFEGLSGAVHEYGPKSPCHPLPGRRIQRMLPSIRIGQAGYSFHFRPSRNNAFAMTMSLRMTAVMASFLDFPVDTNCSYLAFRSGLNRVATTAGK